MVAKVTANNRMMFLWHHILLQDYNSVNCKRESSFLFDYQLCSYLSQNPLFVSLILKLILTCNWMIFSMKTYFTRLHSVKSEVLLIWSSIMFIPIPQKMLFIYFSIKICT